MSGTLVSDVVKLTEGRPRLLLGLAGPPGSGKSTLAAALCRALPQLNPGVVAQDGFHLTNAELAAQNLLDRKGSPATFHAAKLAAMLQLLRSGQTVRAPSYSRTLHEPVPDAVRLGPEAKLVLVEGNYLLLDADPWRSVRRLLDECWYLDVPLDVCLARVRARHIAGGQSLPAAERKVQVNDLPNAELVMTTKARADRILTPGGLKS